MARILFFLPFALIIGGCVTATPPEFRFGETSAKIAEQYRACLFAASDKLIRTPASADDITANAEGECREVYLAYADAVRAEFSSAVNTRAEKQYASDKANAHLRQMQLDSRKVLSDRVGLQSLTGSPTAPPEK